MTKAEKGDETNGGVENPKGKKLNNSKKQTMTQQSNNSCCDVEGSPSAAAAASEFSTQKKKATSNIINADDSDLSDDERDLMDAAAAWAAHDDGDESNDDAACVPSSESRRSRGKKKARKQQAPPAAAAATTTASDSSREVLSEPPENRVFSLHVTQLSYDTTDFDVRHHFISTGCAVTSVRLVYDRALNTKTFRGVAFVDVADEDSHRLALQKLHGSTLLQRKINVRPVKTKQELAAIVKQTTEQVAAQIQEEKAKKKERDKNKDTEKGTNKKKVDGKKERKENGAKRKRGAVDDAVNEDQRKRNRGEDKRAKQSHVTVLKGIPLPGVVGTSNLKKETNKFTADSNPKKKKKLGKLSPSPTSSKKTHDQKSPSSSTSNKLHQSSSEKKKGAKVKLTKQQRNRRAAILRSKGGK